MRAGYPRTWVFLVLGLSAAGIALLALLPAMLRAQAAGVDCSVKLRMKGTQVIAEITVSSRAFELGGVQIISCTLSGEKPLTSLPMEIGELASTRPKTAMLAFNKPEKIGEQTLEVSVRWRSLLSSGVTRRAFSMNIEN